MRHFFYLAEIPPMPLRHLSWMCGVARCTGKVNCEVVMSGTTCELNRGSSLRQAAQIEFPYWFSLFGSARFLKNIQAFNLDASLSLSNNVFASHPLSHMSKENKSNMEYHMSVTRMATSRDIHGTGKFTICTDAVKRTLATMLDYRLLKSPSFLLMAINSTFVCLGYFTTYIFIKDRAVQIGVPKETTFWLISIIGASNTIGRVCCGVIASFSRVDYTLLCSSYLLIGGIATILSVHFDQVIAQVCYAVVFGSFVACVSALRTLIIVETLGLETLTNAVGLTLLFQGAAAVIGVCIAGLLRAATGDYKWSFYFSGTSIIIGALCILPLKRIAKWENFEKKARKQAKINEADMI
ncbi:hypothetical protein NQ317_013097 [Molorchus minor]|uniref:Monocarboxylate transporter n=1 Tax=Molorchus minor TaxID=1323400 RepID=A0ABQ9JWU2_9CUCU|nr:hypothetical protein NQ317_013097 [Molorchus minor]